MTAEPLFTMPSKFKRPKVFGKEPEYVAQTSQHFLSRLQSGDWAKGPFPDEN